MNKRVAVLVVAVGFCGLLGMPVRGAALGSAARLQGEALDRRLLSRSPIPILAKSTVLSHD